MRQLAGIKVKSWSLSFLGVFGRREGQVLTRDPIRHKTCTYIQIIHISSVDGLFLFVLTIYDKTLHEFVSILFIYKTFLLIK